jgi:hypothetical protein
MKPSLTIISLLLLTYTLTTVHAQDSNQPPTTQQQVKKDVCSLKPTQLSQQIRTDLPSHIQL